MNFKNCRRCGKTFVSSGKICPKCVVADEADFKKVRDFVKDNPKVSVEVVVDATGVTEDQIREYLRQGRIDAAGISGNALECKKCGKPIECGDYCVLCRKEIHETLTGSSESGRDGQKSEDNIKPQFARYYRNKG